MTWNFATVFEALARVRPGDTALMHGDRAVSWAELDDRAGRLASALRAAGLSGSVTAQEAERIGLVSTVVDDDKLLQAALDWKPRASTTRRCRRNGHPCTRTGEHAR
ncbi:hypothetical protein [Amycolatopsis acididurans]|uniref:hypothetical protein n=1 Tax=Amycolatopsis acididurans TaxID=2724524 RepID=UPI001B34564E|nr:hypothetical protein [Amycolatopsis acididurans]